MVEIGRINRLSVARIDEKGAWMNGGEFGDILLPRREVPDGCNRGDKLSLFIYCDSSDRLVATVKKPYAQAGEFACLKVVSSDGSGAFLDWGMDKDLFLPKREQKQPLVVGQRYLVRIFVDEYSDKLIASGRINDFLDLRDGQYRIGQQVELLIGGRTELGFKAIVNHSHWGVIYYDQIFKPLRVGDKLTGYIQKVREDGKLDLSLEPAGHKKVEQFSDKLLQALKDNDGYMHVSDKSSPEVIQRLFGVSKAVFKKGVGTLYKQKLIELENGGIRLLK